MMRLRKHIIFAFLLVTFYLRCSAQQTEKVYLSGTGSDDAVQWDFFCTGGMNANRWSKIAVPSCWELQGYGKYDYGFAKDTVRGKEKGLYKHQFKAQASWKEKVVNIVFEGVMTDAEVKINGSIVGPVHQGAFYTFKYDISKYLKYDADNLLEITVAKHSANESVNAAERRADFWIFGGIFRPVWLEVLPTTHINQVDINATAKGYFEAWIHTNGFADEAKVKIYSSDGKLFSSIPVERNAFQFHADSRKPLSPKLWNSESPNLYKAEISLYNKGKLVHQVIKKFGFRTVEVKQRDGIFVNGVKVKFKGVNRHSFRPETGRTLSRKNSIEDILLMKDMNMNAVRMSHYPPDDHFLDACDSLGLFVMDELAGWHGHYDTPTGAKLVKEMLEHDVNHPSIVMWANGNEGGHNFDLDSLFTFYDVQKRPVVHPWQLYKGIETQHYREYNYGIGNYENGREIVMPTEFLHGQFDGGHGAGLEDYWEKMWHNPLSAGGFLWDFADNAVVRTDREDSLDTDKHRAADGILGPHFEKEGSFYAIKEIWSPVYIERREIADGFDGKFNLENRYHYTNLNQCRFKWVLKRIGLNESKEKSGDAKTPDVKPNERGVLNLSLPTDWKDYDVLYVTAIDKMQRELFTWSFPISDPKKIANRIVKKEGASSINVKEIDSLLNIRVDKIETVFNKNNGLLFSVANGKGKLPFNNGPFIQEGETNFRNIKYGLQGKNFVIESGFDKKGSYNKVQWTIYPSGWVRLELNYFPSAYFTNFIGANFSLPEDQIESVNYLGYGPYRVWKNRMKGNSFNVWEKKYNNSETGESPWKYPEFKGYHAGFYGGRFNTKDNGFIVATETEDLFLRLYTPAWKTDQWHNYEPIFPSGDISFMQGISSIGTKTQRNETTGPMGSKNIFYDYEKDPDRALKMVLYFYFSENLKP